MIFLGKYNLKYGANYLTETNGKLSLTAISPDAPSAQFLAYDVGNNQFTLQAANGQWISFSSGEAPNAWYQVLYSASTGQYPNRFHLPFFDIAGQSMRLAWDNGEAQVALLMTSGGINPYCKCEFDVATGWNYGLSFNALPRTPGVPQMQQTKEAAGADFSCIVNACINLSGVDLSGVNLRGAKFRGADLRGTNFTGADLSDASLVAANVSTQTKFTGAVLKGTDFSELDLVGNSNFSSPPDFSTDVAHRTKFINSKIDASLIGLNWSFLDLTGASIMNLKKGLAKLQARQAVLTGINLGAADGETPFDLEESNFSGAVMTGAQLQRAILTAAKLDGVNLRAANLSGADLTSASLAENAVLGRDDTNDPANLSQTTILRTDFTAADLVAVNFDRAVIGYETKFNGAKMAETSFVEADLTGLSLQDAHLEGADFTRANLTNCDLRNAKLRAEPPPGDAEHDANRAERADREGEDIRMARLNEACLLGADLTGARLEGVSLVNAVLAFKPGNLYRKDSLALAYKPTIFPADITDAATTCPANDSGPCTGPKLMFQALPSNMA